MMSLSAQILVKQAGRCTSPSVWSMLLTNTLQGHSELSSVVGFALQHDDVHGAGARDKQQMSDHRLWAAAATLVSELKAEIEVNLLSLRNAEILSCIC